MEQLRRARLGVTARVKQGKAVSMTYPTDPGFGADPFGRITPPPQRDPATWGQPTDPEPTMWDTPSLYPAQPSNDQPAPPPPKSRTGLLVVAALGVVAMLVIAVGAGAATIRRAHDSSAAALPVPGGMDPTAPPGVPFPERLSYTEYAEDWNFRFDGVELSAQWVDGRDYADCSDIEVAAALTEMGCAYATELVLRAEDGALMLTQFILDMADPELASEAGLVITDADLDLREGSYLRDFAVGKWQAADVQGTEFVVVTVATATDAVDEQLVKQYLSYRQSDTELAIMFR